MKWFALLSCFVGSVSAQGRFTSGCIPGDFTDMFLYFDARRSFDNAVNVCIGEGGQLARVSSQTEFDFLINFLLSSTFEELNRGCWIGIHDPTRTPNAQGTGRFEFVDGSAQSFFNVNPGTGPWLVGQPDNLGGGEACVDLVRKNGIIGMNDAQCSTTLEVICRKPCDKAPPTRSPTITPQPTGSPTSFPTGAPTKSPTTFPSKAPTESPTHLPTESPTLRPTNFPTESPTDSPTVFPTQSPSDAPTSSPSSSPSESPTSAPSRSPSVSPTRNPTTSPTQNPTRKPTESPTPKPTKSPVIAPTFAPSTTPTSRPTSSPATPTVKSGDDGLSLAVYGGIAGGGLVMLLVVAFVIAAMIKGLRNRKRPAPIKSKRDELSDAEVQGQEAKIVVTKSDV